MKDIKLPKLDYDYAALEPHISEEQLKIHHQKHHQAYINAANDIIAKMEEARKNNQSLDMKSTLKSLSFNIGGHVLHSIFWKNMTPNGGGTPNGKLKQLIDEQFGSFERFQEEFSGAALSVEGSGWAALTYKPEIEALMLMQIEKHNVNLIPEHNIIMVLDMWEHAYYLDRKNEKNKFVEAYWNIVNWEDINMRIKLLSEEE